MPAILITGSSGYLGNKLMLHLERLNLEYSILGCDIENPSQDYHKATFIKADIRHPLMTEILKSNQVETLVHLAFANTTKNSVADVHEINVVGTMKILAACKLAAVKRVVIASSFSAYGCHYDNPLYMNEEFPLRGYNQSQLVKDKIDVENLAFQFVNKNPNISLIVFRSVPVIGSNAFFFNNLYIKKFVPVLMGFDPLLQYIDINDWLTAIEKFLQFNTSEIFNLAPDKALPLKRIIRLAEAIPVPVPEMLFSSYLAMFWNMKLSNTESEQLAFLKYPCTLSNSKMKKLLNFQPRFSTKNALIRFTEKRRVQNIIEQTKISPIDKYEEFYNLN